MDLPGPPADESQRHPSLNKNFQFKSGDSAVRGSSLEEYLVPFLSITTSSTEHPHQILSNKDDLESNQRQFDCLAKENATMHQTINNLVVTLARWMKQNQEQSEHVKLLSEMLEDSERERAKLRNELESMNSQMQMNNTKWVEERRKLGTSSDMELAKQMILKLQEENWRLRKNRSIVLTARGPTTSATSSESPTSSHSH